MIQQGNWPLALLLFLIGETVAVAQPQTPISPPDPEFLEFLGGWELDDGTWINPLDFLDDHDHPNHNVTPGKWVEESQVQESSDESNHENKDPIHAPEP